MHGDKPLTSRLLTPVLAQTGQVADTRELHWDLTFLLLSQPLHFGDYGGMPMQILWALLDIATIVVLGSGLYLWLKRGNSVPVPKAKAEGGDAKAAGGAQPVAVMKEARP